MPNKPPRSGPDKYRAMGGPSITEWNGVLLGKQLIHEDAENNENVVYQPFPLIVLLMLQLQTFKKSELPRDTMYMPAAWPNLRVHLGRSVETSSSSSYHRSCCKINLIQANLDP